MTDDITTRPPLDGAATAATAKAPGPTRASRIPAGFVLLLGAMVGIGPLTIDLYLAAFPRITTDLATTPAAVQFTITATLAGLALGQLLIGSLSDAIGRRRPLIAGLTLYIVASLIIVVVPSVGLLAGARFLQGLGASAGMVLSMAIVRDRFEGVQVGKVLARLMLVVGVAPAVAPLIGAQFLLLGTWRWMFVALAAFGGLLLALAVFVVPESLPVERRRAGGVGPAIRSYLGLLGDRTFMALALLSGFSMAGIFTYVSTATFVYQGEFGLSTQQFAVLFASGAIAITAGTQLNGLLVGRVAPTRILTVAVVTSLVVAAALVTFALTGAGLVPLVIALLATLLCAGVLLPAVPVIALEANAHRAGSAAALLGAVQFGVGAAAAPLTGLFGGGGSESMAIVMSGAAAVTGLLVLVARRGFPSNRPAKVLAAG